MLFQKKSLTNILMVALVIAVVGLLFFFFEKINEKNYEPLNAIPESSSFFFQVNSIDQFYHQLDQNAVWNNLLFAPNLREFKIQIQQFDSLFHLKSGNKKIIDEQNAIISIHPDSDHIQLLLIAKLKGNLKRKFFRTIFNQLYDESFTTLRTIENGVAFNKLVFNQHKQSFTYALYSGLFIGSWNYSLVLESVNQLKQGNNLQDDESYWMVAETAGKNVDANIFINYRKLPAFFNQLMNNQNIDSLDFFSGLADWSALDLMIKKDELLFSGFTSTQDSSNKYLDLFKNQKPQLFEMAKIIPASATFFHHFGIQNFNKYFSGLQNFIIEQNKTKSTLQKIENLNKVLKSDVEKSFIPHLGSELALVSLATNSKSFADNSYAIIKVKNTNEIKAYLKKLATNNSGSRHIKNYLEHSIDNVNINDFVPLIFGNSFKIIQEFNYTFIDEYLIIANSNSALEKYIRLFKNGKTLIKDSEFIAFSDNMSEESNYFFYFKINKALNLLEYFSTPKIYDFLIKNASIIKNNEAIGLQYSNQKNGLFTNLSINYNKNPSLENDWVWQANLDNTIVGEPKLVNNHQNQSGYTMVTDVQDQIYLFNYEGTRLWKHQMDGELLSEIYEVDYFKNGKIQYLFNTKNSLYLIDVSGKLVSGYPHKLRVQASNGISLFDYSNNRDYRIVYAGTDKNIYNYNSSGIEVKGWTSSQTANRVQSEIQHLVGNNRDYILLADENGSTRILNRLGKDRILLKAQFSRAKNSKFYVNSTNNKGLFITTNNSGKLTYIKSNGNLEYSDFGNYSADHFFLYVDFDSDGHQDFIYVDGTTLKIFNRFKEEIFQSDFTAKISTPPLIFKGIDEKIVIGIYNSEDQKIYLFDMDGQIEDSLILNGSDKFLVTDLLKNGSLNLIIGSDKSIKNYLIK